jgi:hypothetical protein
MTNYQELLAKVKAENPEMPHKEAMKKASELNKNLLLAQKALENKGDEVPEQKTGNIDKGTLIDAEKRIRELGVNINTIINTGREVIPNGKIVKNGPSGVNTLVSWEDEAGNRLPVEGSFIVWI